MLPVLKGMAGMIYVLMAQPPAAAVQKKLALAELTNVLQHREKFIKAHAAEYLVWTGHSNPALRAFTKEAQLHEGEPKYRIVIWRILAQAEKAPGPKKRWLDKIYAAYTDMNGPDRTHATESLAKLQQPVNDLFPGVTAKTLASTDRALQVYALWASAYGSAARVAAVKEKLLHLLLHDSDWVARKISAYALRRIGGGLARPQWEQLAAAALSARREDKNYITLLTTAWVTAPFIAGSKKTAAIDKLLTGDMKGYPVGEQIELALALAEKGTQRHVPLLLGMMNDQFSSGIYDRLSDEAADLHAAAAYAILKINSR